MRRYDMISYIDVVSYTSVTPDLVWEVFGTTKLPGGSFLSIKMFLLAS